MSEMKYHYTSVDATTSMYRVKNLRMTRSEFLNDPADCKVLFSLIEKYLAYKSAEIENHLNSSDLRQLYEKAPLVNYIAFLQNHIHLYVLSLTGNNDQMSMWNYYGSGGMQLSIDIDQLIGTLHKNLLQPNQYLAYSDVKYVSDTDTVETISFEPFCSFHLDTKDHKNIFKTHSTRSGRSGAVHPLYQTTTLSGFVDTYITGYIRSIEYLSSINCISMTNSAEEIFKAIYNNTNDLDNYYEFKKDLTLYMIVLSALLKNDTYSFEKEFRVVYFENTLSPLINTEYTVSFLQGQKYLRPYMEIPLATTEFIREITLSPLTRNIPIDSELYTEIISEFIQKESGHSTNVNWSKHKIRW